MPISAEDLMLLAVGPEITAGKAETLERITDGFAQPVILLLPFQRTGTYRRTINAILRAMAEIEAPPDGDIIGFHRWAERSGFYFLPVPFGLIRPAVPASTGVVIDLLDGILALIALADDGCCVKPVWSEARNDKASRVVPKVSRYLQQAGDGGEVPPVGKSERVRAYRKLKATHTADRRHTDRN